ncbi:hypothetical protein PHLGIDRAFT_124923 [Phlebiopsis gigantea 11061_1 CR5-6]|uniref:Uncharacterized protein n=1 Tax=Phlebiopsis gigantea (strain 11061_1 CR5-6) TaxID=745531 RepID=A0A0C3P0G7_PHLG1|nr:hypothetical protein PHLGIDRAFT_124923 [Phlebiopsis gigantea 11061_1 CR5-6]
MQQSSSEKDLVFAYRFNDDLVYLTPKSGNYHDVIDIVKEGFPELRRMSSDLIALYVRVSIDKKPKTVRIGESAWSKVAPTLPRYEILDIRVMSSRCSSPSDSDLPPRYADVKDPGLLNPQAPVRAPSPNLIGRLMGKK